MVKLVKQNFEENGKAYSRLYTRGNSKAYIISPNNTEEEQQRVLNAIKEAYIKATKDLYV